MSCVASKIPRYLPKYSSIKSTDDLRSSFIEYFRSQNHHYFKPCKVSDGKGTYFINAGVGQFIDMFNDDNSDVYKFKNIVNSQRCIRLGGKDCDWKHVGFDPIHLLYFEMLGNWSFGSYGKEKACAFMWEYLTEVLKLPASHLYVTYFGGSKELGIPEDEATRDIWLNLGVKSNKLLQFGSEHNFWKAKPKHRLRNDFDNSELCGYSTEIHWDYLATAADTSNEGTRSSTLDDTAAAVRCARCFVNSGSPEVVEVWNCVFMKYMRHYNNDDNASVLEPLPHTIVDTGMGLERLATVTQGCSTVYDTDYLKQIISHISSIGGIPEFEALYNVERLEFPISVKDGTSVDFAAIKRDNAYRIVADHMRAFCAAVCDNILPGRVDNQRRVRQLLQRSVRQAALNLNIHGQLYRLVDSIVPSLKGQIDITPDIISGLKNLIHVEEVKFLKNFQNQEKAFKKYLESKESNDKHITDSDLSDLIGGKYGTTLSKNMIQAMAADEGISVFERAGLNTNFQKDRQFFLSSNLEKLKDLVTDTNGIYNYEYDTESGLYKIKDVDTKVIGTTWNENRLGLVLAETNFFSGKGGQDCDEGWIILEDGNKLAIENVEEMNNFVIHWVTAVNDGGNMKQEGIPVVGSSVRVGVNCERRTGNTIHQTAQHLVSGVLSEMLGDVESTSSSVHENYAKVTIGLHVGVLGNRSDAAVNYRNLQTNINQFVADLEARCNSIIEQNSQTEIVTQPVSSDNNTKVVNLISAGGDFAWQEQCSGTNCQKMEELKCIKITGVKGAKRGMIEFQLTAGPLAQKMEHMERSQLDPLFTLLAAEPFIHKYEVDEFLNKFKKISDYFQRRDNSSYLTRLKVRQARKHIYAVYNKIPNEEEFLRRLRDNSIKEDDDLTLTLQSDLNDVKKIIELLSHENNTKPILLFDSSIPQFLLDLPKTVDNATFSSLFDNIRRENPKWHIYSPTVNFGSQQQDSGNHFICITLEDTSDETQNFQNMLEYLKTVVVVAAES